MSLSNTYSSLVSVVIPCYNHAQFVQETIQSVIDQDYEKIELIIIDDGSKDNSVNVIKELIPACERRFIRFEFRDRPNKGLCATLNEAFGWCQGKYFSPIASDDILEHNKISYLVSKAFQEPEVVAYYGAVKCIGDTTGHVIGCKERVYTFSDIFLNGDLPPAPGVMFRSECLLEVGGFSSDAVLEDLDILLKLLDFDSRVVKSYPLIVTRYRRHVNSTTNDIYKMHLGRLQVLSKYKHRLGYDLAVLNANDKFNFQLSRYKMVKPILYVLLRKKADRYSFLVLLRSCVPSFIFSALKKIF